MIVEILVDDDPQPRHRHGGIGAGTHAQMHFGARGEPVDARVDADELGTALHEVDDRMAEQAVTIGSERHLAPHDHDLRHVVLGVIVGTFQTTRVVHFRVVRTENMRTGHGARLVACITGLRVACVRRAQNCLCHVGNEDAARAARSGEHGHAFRTVGVAEVIALLLHDGERLIPTDAFPLVVFAAEFRVALHRVNDTARVVHVILERQAPRA